MIIFVKTMKLAGSPAGAQPAQLKHAVALAILALTTLSGCGGEESGQSTAPPVIATPSPSPTPTLTPPPTQLFAAVVGKIFDDPTNIKSLTLMGRGWSQEFNPDGSERPTNGAQRAAHRSNGVA